MLPEPIIDLIHCAMSVAISLVAPGAMPVDIPRACLTRYPMQYQLRRLIRYVPRVCNARQFVVSGCSLCPVVSCARLFSALLAGLDCNAAKWQLRPYAMSGGVVSSCSWVGRYGPSACAFSRRPLPAAERERHIIACGLPAAGRLLALRG
eukprot:14590267-Alexandrium_andersonii.AAC.1